MAAAKDNLDTPTIVLVGMLFAILTFVIVVILQAYFQKMNAEEYYRKSIAPRSEELSSALADQQETLHSYRWIDQQKGIVGIPIERAMALQLQETTTDSPR